MSHVPLLIPMSLLLAALVIPLAGLWRRGVAYPVALLGSGASSLIAFTGLLRVVGQGETLRYHLGGWPSPVGIEYVLDPLSAFMAAIVTGMGFLVLLSSRRPVLEAHPQRVVPFYAVSLLLLSGLTGIVVTGDLFNLYVFLEIASLAAYALLATGEDAAPVAAFRYLILGNLGGSLYLLGVGFLYFATGSLNMAEVAGYLAGLHESRAVAAAASLMAVGLALKMALFPLHLWLPDVYTYAASPATALIAPIMTKVSAYALVRLLLTVFTPAYLRDTLPVTDVLAWMAAAGILFGSILAIAQTDLRRMLAYSSISQVAYVGLGIGLGNPLGLIGALLHILNHAAMKACLFLVAGSIRFRTGHVDTAAFAGLGRRMPWTLAAFTAAALSMVGVPPTAGFFSKWYLLLGGLEGQRWLFVGVIVVSSLLTAVYFFRLLERAYARQPAAEPASGNLDAPSRNLDPPLEMLLPILVLAAAILLLGLLNVAIVRQVLEGIAAPLAPSPGPVFGS